MEMLYTRLINPEQQLAVMFAIKEALNTLHLHQDHLPYITPTQYAMVLNVNPHDIHFRYSRFIF